MLMAGAAMVVGVATISTQVRGDDNGERILIFYSYARSIWIWVPISIDQK
uniref:Uncharacterized protein n=1 Tax=Setaria italica TaxID=4555 RepID=K3YKS3_SETIT